MFQILGYVSETFVSLLANNNVAFIKLAKDRESFPIKLSIICSIIGTIFGHITIAFCKGFYRISKLCSAVISKT